MAFVSMILAFLAIIIGILVLLLAMGLIFLIIGIVKKRNPQNKGKKHPAVASMILILVISLVTNYISVRVVHTAGSLMHISATVRISTMIIL